MDYVKIIRVIGLVLLVILVWFAEGQIKHSVK